MRRLAGLLAVALLAACAAQDDLSGAPEPIGQFRLGHNIAIADDVQTLPGLSRRLSEQEIEAVVQSEVARRLRRYDGDGLYHLGLNVGGLVLAQPGVPLVYTPSSRMIVDVTVFDNRTQSKLNDEPKRFIVGEGLRNVAPIIGSGLARGPQEQLRNLSESFAAQLEGWLRENEDWFAPRADQARVPFDPPPGEILPLPVAPEDAAEGETAAGS